MSNVAGKAYGMNVVTPMRPYMTWLNTFLFMVSRALPSTLSGLLGLSLIHFARWTMIRRDQWPQRGQQAHKLKNDYMLFCSNFNGTWDQYIDAFADGIPGGLNLFWYSSTKYPGAIPITPFKNYIRANQVDTNYYYNATPGSAQRDIKMALGLAATLRGVDLDGDDATLARSYQNALAAVQGALGSPGYAPIASCDTSNAESRRCEAVSRRWGAQGAGPPRAIHVVNAVDPAVVRASPVSEDGQAAVRKAITQIVPGSVRLADAPKLKPREAYPPPKMLDSGVGAKPQTDRTSDDA
jgi:hypothetical protein